MKRHAYPHGGLQLRAITLVLKNFSRRTGRSILSSTGLILAIAVIVSTFTLSESMELQIGNEIEKYGPNIIITPKTSSVNVPYGSVTIGDVTIPESSVDKIYMIPTNQNLRVLSPKLYGYIEYGNSSFLLVGVIPEKEMELKRWWNLTGSLPQPDVNEIIVGSAVGSSLGLTIGSPIQIKNTMLTVVGSLRETGSIDDYCVFSPLRVAQRLLNLPDKVSVIDIGALCNDCPVETISQQIMDVLPEVRATPIRQAVETRMKAVEETADFTLLLGSIILVVGCAGVMNTMLASVHERLKEIGIFLSLGAEDTDLYKLFFFESIILGFVGGFIGALVGLISSMFVGPVFIGIPISLVELPLHLVPFSIILSVSVCLIACLYPAWRASQTDPVKALKTV